MLATALVLLSLTAPVYTPTSDNPYFPLKPGMRWVYEGSEDGARLHEIVRVRRQVEHVTGIPCAIVEDRLWADGRLAESTLDWYAQDRRGRVWYFGEDTRELDRRGRTTSTEGSWRTGIDGARPGIIMPARPRVGQAFLQEHYPGQAEDHFRILSRRGGILRTAEWTPLEPGVRDRKWYRRDVGVIEERTIRGGDERLKLVSFERQ